MSKNVKKSTGVITIFHRMVTIILFIAVLYGATKIIDADMTISRLQRKVLILEKQNDSKYVPIKDEKLLEYIDKMDAKADAAIDKVVAVVGTIFTVATLISVVLVFQAPRGIELKLSELDEKIKEIDAKNEIVRVNSLGIESKLCELDDKIKEVDIKSEMLILSATEINSKLRELDDKFREVDTKNDRAMVTAEEAHYQARIWYALKEDTSREKIYVLNQVINDYPDKDWAYIYRGRIFTMIGKIDNAISDYEKAMKLGDHSAIVYNHMANLYQGEKEYKKAFNFYTKAIDEAKLDKSDNGKAYMSRIYSNRGACYSEMNNFKKALIDFKKALDCDSDNDAALYNRALLYQKQADITNEHNLKKEYYKDALKDIRKAFNLEKEDENYEKLMKNIKSKLAGL